MIFLKFHYTTSLLDISASPFQFLNWVNYTGVFPSNWNEKFQLSLATLTKFILEICKSWCELRNIKQKLNDMIFAVVNSNLKCIWHQINLKNVPWLPSFEPMTFSLRLWGAVL